MSYTDALVVTPNAVDAQLAQAFLLEGGIRSEACGSMIELCRRLAIGGGCVVLVEDALMDDDLPMLREALEAQPPWSDIPLVLVASEGAELLDTREGDNTRPSSPTTDTLVDT